MVKKELHINDDTDKRQKILFLYVVYDMKLTQKHTSNVWLISIQFKFSIVLICLFQI